MINFLKIDRLDLLKQCPYAFLVTDHVEAELSDFYQDQVRCFQKGFQDHIFAKISLTDPEELAHFARFSEKGTLGAGECSAIAAAVHRQLALAMDDVRAIKRAKDLAPQLFILRTQDLILLLIQERVISIEHADTILHEWIHNHRYRLKISSFQELLPHFTGATHAR